MQQLHLTTRSMPPCEVCAAGNLSSYSPARALSRRFDVPGAVLHYDVFGPTSVPSLSGGRFGALAVDDATRKVWAHATTNRIDAMAWAKALITRLAHQGHVLRTFISDNAPELTSHSFKEFLGQQHVDHILSVPNEVQHNGLIERMIRTVVETTRRLLLAAGMRAPFWAVAFSHAVLLFKIPSPMPAFDYKSSPDQLAILRARA